MIGLMRRRTVMKSEPVYLMTSESNPEAMLFMFERGYAAHPDYMTFKEALAVTSLSGWNLGDNNITTFTHFDEFQYFTNIRSIGSGLFQYTALTTLTLPPTVATINGTATFYGSTSLRRLIVPRSTPPTLNSSGASLNRLSRLVIYVPDESVDTYKAATGWSVVASKIQPMSNLT